ncbi:hypothetical protein PJP10_03805 [Mycobacterium kansasii]
MRDDCTRAFVAHRVVRGRGVTALPPCSPPPPAASAPSRLTSDPRLRDARST